MPAIYAGLVKVRQNAKMKKSRYSLNAGKFLTESESKHLEFFLRRSLEGPDFRNALLLLLAMRTGARATEILNLRKDDFFIRENRGHVFIRGIKGSNDREIPLHPWLTKALKLHASELIGPHTPLFPISYHRMREIWVYYRPVKKPLHSLRHTFAIEQYRKHQDLKLVMTALGHRNIANTMIYLDYHYSSRELMRLVF